MFHLPVSYYGDSALLSKSMSLGWSTQPKEL
jgi:hypothetical protein